MAETPPRVFIGLPVYNGERFLAQTLDSLRAQSFTDFTLLIADNASTDRTPTICEHYCASDPRVHCIRHQQNIGGAQNWNFLVQQAQGQYFKWATANDECSPDFLARCVAALDADPSAVLCQGRTCLVDEDSGERNPYAQDLALMDDRPSLRLRRLLMQLALNNGQSGLIRLAALKQTKLERPYPSGDIALMAELAMRGRFIVLPQVLLDRRMGCTTFSGLFSREKTNDFYINGNAHQPIAQSEFKLHRDLLCVVLCAPVSLKEKCLATAFTLRRMAWELPRLKAKLRQWVKLK